MAFFRAKSSRGLYLSLCIPVMNVHSSLNLASHLLFSESQSAMILNYGMLNVHARDLIDRLQYFIADARHLLCKAE